MILKFWKNQALIDCYWKVFVWSIYIAQVDFFIFFYVIGFLFFHSVHLFEWNVGVDKEFCRLLSMQTGFFVYE